MALGGCDTSNSAGKMMLQMLGMFAEFEHAIIVERTRVGVEKKAKNGESCGGGVPFGCIVDRGAPQADAWSASVVEQSARSALASTKS